MPYSDVVFLRRLIELLTRYIIQPDTTPNGRLYMTAVSVLGTDASPNDVAPDELACAETVDTIYKKAFGAFIEGGVGPTLSTTALYNAFSSSHNWLLLTPSEVVPGCVVISPTGMGTNPQMPHGHVGIVSSDDKIMSNTSATGLWMENYSLASWRERYVVGGGYPMLFFKKIS